jgi:DNA-binding protein HU-beta
MHKSDLAKKVAEKTGLSHKDAEAAVDTAFDLITDALAAGEKVVITGFGTFERKERKERTGRHPSTGKEISIPKKRAASFSAGKLLKEKVET